MNIQDWEMQKANAACPWEETSLNNYDKGRLAEHGQASLIDCPKTCPIAAAIKRTALLLMSPRDCQGITIPWLLSTGKDDMRVRSPFLGRFADRKR